MERRQFIKTCGTACIGIGLGISLSSCFTGQALAANLVDGKLILDKPDLPEGQIKVVTCPDIQYPIALVFLENTYQAFLMSCSHQGSQLDAFGEKFVCPAHGSSFNNKGEVLNGPASTNLRAFRTEIINNQLIIDLD